MISADRLTETIQRLDRWLVANGWHGWDPYDLPSRQRTLAKQGWAGQVRARYAGLVARFAPLAARRIAEVQPAINAKAMGLLAEGYRKLYLATKNESYLGRAQEALAWLRTHPATDYPGLSWGYPFDWQSRIFIPRGTPSSVVTATAGRAILGFYRQTGNPEHLESCQQICKFFLAGLHQDRIDAARLCFSYTPMDRFHVHNANLMVSEFLMAVDKEANSRTYHEPAQHALAYTLSEQNGDGSICYWGRDQAPNCMIDHYHSGFEIRSLYRIWKTTADDTVRDALKNYYAFYCRKLFDKHRQPKLTPQRMYPINIHAAAEAILCHSTLAPDFEEARDYLDVCVPWTIDQMQLASGAFAYTKRFLAGVIPWRVEIPYLRWGQAWMLRALAEYAALRARS